MSAPCAGLHHTAEACGPLHVPRCSWRARVGARSVVYVRDVLTCLRYVTTGSVHCVVTSPPYWGLRDYGIAPTIWPAVTFRPAFDLPPVTVPAMVCALGLEPDLLAFLAHLVLVFREVARVLRPDGVCWVNLGDSYSTGTNAGRKPSGRTDVAAHAGRSQAQRRSPPGLAPKNLLLQPHRAALALQADGWVLRGDDVWEKASPVPESVTDRTTRAHEYVFQFSRGQRYFYDASAVAEPASHAASRNSQRTYGSSRGRTGDHRAVSVPWAGVNRNPRSVWRLAAEPFAGSHFATFPSRLALRCILAGTSAHGACAECGAPYTPVTRKTVVGPVWKQEGPRTGQHERGDLAEGRRKFAQRHQTRVDRVGWSKSCACASDAVAPSVVLDPFAGSGTTLAVAEALGRAAIGVEAQPLYVTDLMPARFADVAARFSRAASAARRPKASPAPAHADGPLFARARGRAG